MADKDESIEIKKGYTPPKTPLKPDIHTHGYTPPPAPKKSPPQKTPQQPPNKK